MKEILENYLRFIDAEADSDKPFDPDVKIEDQFDLIDELDFRLATLKFEMDSLIEIPAIKKQYVRTLREVVEEASKRGKIEKADAPSFLKQKKTEMNKVAQEMALELQNMFG